MGKFATPQWDTNTVGDEICNNLFKLNSKSKGKQKEKLKNGGKIVKAKLKKTKKLINEKLVKNVSENVNQIKNFVSKKKNKMNQQKQEMLERNNSNTSNGNQMNSHERLRKKKKKPKLKNLPNIKHIKNMLKTKLSSGEEDQKNLFSEDANHTFSNKNQEVNTSKNKRKKKKIKNLQKDMTEKIESDIVEAEKKTKKKRKNSKRAISDERIDTEDWDMNDTVNSNSVEDTSLVKRSNDKKSYKTSSLRERMLAKLKSSRFRYLNEQLYCSPSKDAQNMFKSDPDSFKAYHEGFRQQVDRWPVNPVDIIIKSIKKMNKSHVIADFGCGDAKIAQEVKQKVHSFDLAATNERVTACDMANVPLAKESVDVAVFCLSLMGTNLKDYLKEANRVLKIGGILKIAEVESRFDDVDGFIKGVQCFGFQNIYKDLSHNLFYFIDFKKIANTKKGKGLPSLNLNPCLYKKR